MAIAFVKATAKSSFAGVDSTSVNFASLPSAGNLIVVYATTFNGAMPAGVVTDNQGNSYTRAVDIAESLGDEVAIFYAANIGTPSGTFTVTLNPSGASNNIVVLAAEYSGAAGSGVLDQTATFTSTASSTSMPSGTTPTTAQADELLCAVHAPDETVGPFTWTAEAGWTKRMEETDGSITAALGVERIVAATGAYSHTATISPAQANRIGCIATFKAAGLPPGLGPVVGMAEPMHAEPALLRY